MTFRVILCRKRKGISRHYEIVVKADDREKAIRRACKLMHGMSVFRVVNLTEIFQQ